MSEEHLNDPDFVSDHMTKQSECSDNDQIISNICRQASLTEIERGVLSNLLIDDKTSDSGCVRTIEEHSSKRGSAIKLQNVTRTLNDNMLFSVISLSKEDSNQRQNNEANFEEIRCKFSVPLRTDKNQANHIGLWRNNEEGAWLPAFKRWSENKSRKLSEKLGNISLYEKESEVQMNSRDRFNDYADDTSNKIPATKERNFKDTNGYETTLNSNENGIEEEEFSKNQVNSGEDSSVKTSIKSDEQVRMSRRTSNLKSDDASNASSWDLDHGGFDHYDAWAVLKDEYAEDFGFGFSGCNDSTQLSMNGFLFGFEDEESDHRNFKIIGTSADDISTQPHVLSPPLMDSLLNFVPESIAGQNLWLKYSLVRDGASLETMRRYVRAAPHTILAIETITGHVFGCFTSSPWRVNNGYFGSGEAFLWKVRHSRMTPCFSLFDQAQMESEIDVYPYSSVNDYVQLCTIDKIGVGGGQLKSTNSGSENLNDDGIERLSPAVHLEEAKLFGFGIALSDDLLHGTTSPCATFRNPCLVNHSSYSEAFEVCNVEAWAFTPRNTVEEAEKLEMAKFFVQKSLASTSSSGISSCSGSPSLCFCSGPGGDWTSSGINNTRSRFLSEDFNQKKFYRRIGEQDENDIDREVWMYADMMNSQSSQNSFMRSPNFCVP